MIEFSQAGGDTTSIYLTPEQGEMLRSVIEKESQERFSRYVESVGLQPTNILGVLAGRRKVSYKTLMKLFSKIEYHVECRVEFLIQKETGQTVSDASSVNLDEMLYCGDGAGSGQDQLTGTDSPSTINEHLRRTGKVDSY